jgi:hypothetical protein
MNEGTSTQVVLRSATAAIDEQRLVRDVEALQPDWSELEAYAGPLPPQVVRAFETAAEFPVEDREWDCS